MNSNQVVEKSAINKNPFGNYPHQDDQSIRTTGTPSEKETLVASVKVIKLEPMQLSKYKYQSDFKLTLKNSFLECS